MKINSNLSQWEKRVISFKFIYSCLVLELNKQEMIEKYNCEIKLLDDIYINNIIIFFIENKEKLFKQIMNLLQPNWTIDRVNLIDLSVVCCTISESNVHKIDKKILIDQAVITAKKYGDQSSYKFVNSILDKVLV